MLTNFHVEDEYLYVDRYGRTRMVEPKKVEISSKEAHISPGMVPVAEKDLGNGRKVTVYRKK